MTPQLWRDCSLDAEADHEARSHPHCGPRQERTMSGISDVTNQSDYHS